MNGKPVFTVPAKTIINFKSGFQKKLLCDGPTFSAGTACALSCSYCYVPDAMRKQKHWLEKHGVTGEHEDVVIRRDDAVTLVRKQLIDGRDGVATWKHRSPYDTRVIYASPLVDVAANMELVQETIEICRVILDGTFWQIRLLSKSNLLPKIAQAFHQYRDRMIFGVSTGTLDDGIAKAIEAGTPLVSKRIQSLHWLQDNGFRTFGMICPSLPQWEFTSQQRFSENMAKTLRADKLEHVWAEVINVRGDSMNRTIDALEAGNQFSAAQMLHDVAISKPEWERQARLTYLAHSEFFKKPGQLRFLQYVTKDTKAWWEDRKEQGAVVL